MNGLEARQGIHVYLIARRDGARVHAPVRIGIAEDLPAQVGELQACCPFEITLVHVLRFPAGLSDAQQLQGGFESRYVSQSLGRGWFDMAPAEALSGLLTQLDLIVSKDDDSLDKHWALLNALNAGDEANETLCFLRTDVECAK